MLDNSVAGIQDVLANGLAVLLIALALDFVRDAVVETGDTYVSILGDFATKRETALLLLAFSLGGAYVSGVAQAWLVGLLAQNLMLALGVGIWAVLVMTNLQAQSWNLLSTDDPVLVGVAVLGTLLVVAALL